MLTIANGKNGDGHVAETNFWHSEYNQRGLVYLSRHSKALRLFLPTAHLGAWLPDIETAKSVTLEPPARQGYPNNIDIVFEDGSDCPFSLCIDKAKQLDFTPHFESTKIIIYLGSLNDYITLPCEIKLGNQQPQKTKEQYIYHVTVDTGHARKSPKSEVPSELIGQLKQWVKDMLDGQLRGIFDTKYTCRVGKHHSKLCEFVISKTDDNFNHTDLVNFVVCRESRHNRQAWKLVGGQGNAPEVPFCAVKLHNQNIQLDDMFNLSLFADFERCIAWAWLDLATNKEDK
ncbi:hypothetical protein [[Haemophilus] ducreyi]|uniref:Uncharacterized protein n=2 Tax=Haemophilus ducreyi TaxID=730 RepID=Q7VPC7_HAEDU|nr:hypothetical protein [[Haemophilus] ducreyi]AAP95154.1 hypothetical protein HD_0159 [[Haemophilus] ducreyi 35000HP]